MKKGDKVKIYQKPISKEDYEGEATLVRKNLSNEINNTESWFVKFKGDNRLSVRTIKKED